MRSCSGPLAGRRLGSLANPRARFPPCDAHRGIFSRQWTGDAKQVAGGAGGFYANDRSPDSVLPRDGRRHPAAFPEPTQRRREHETKGEEMTIKRCRHTRTLSLAAAAIVVGGVAFATPSFGTGQTAVATALYTGIEIGAKRPDWKASLTVKGVSDAAVTNNTAIPGGSSGWHSHPGLSIVSVTQGAVWLYDADDPTCTPTIVAAGHGFVEAGDHVHILRNEGSIDARWTTTSIRPAGSAGRIDQPDPGHCAF